MSQKWWQKKDAEWKQEWHREGNKYWKLMEYIRNHKVFTRQELVYEAGFSQYDVTIVLSPRLMSTRGDLRGNPACKGRFYYILTYPKRYRGEHKRFSFRWRETPLNKRDRPEVIEAQRVEAEKTRTVKNSTVTAKKGKKVAHA